MNDRKKSAGFFIAGQFVSMFGTLLVQHAITWSITLETKSGIMMMVFTCVGLLPMVIISPFAGVWADRYDRKKMIVISDSCIALVTLLLAILYISGIKDLRLMLIVVMVRSFGQGIQQPAVGAMIPQIVPQEQLQRFNGIQSSVQSFTMLASPLLGGVLLTFLPIEYIFFIDVVTAAIGISIIYLLVRVPKTERVPSNPGMKAYFHELKEGVLYIGKKAWLKTLLSYSIFFSFFVCPAAMLTPLQTVRTFGDDVWRLTAIEVLFSVGMMLGGVLMAIWGGFKNKSHTIVFASVAFGLVTVLLGIVPLFWIYLCIMALCGFVVPMFNTSAVTILQTNIEPQIMGRVMGVYMMLNSLSMPIGMVVFGPLGDAVRIELLLIVTGTIILLSGFVLLGMKDLMRIGKPAVEPAKEES